jgi:hypothetical protein
MSCLVSDSVLSLQSKVLLEIRASTTAYHTDSNIRLLEIQHEIQQLVSRELTVEAKPSSDTALISDQGTISASSMSVSDREVADVLSVHATYRLKCEPECHCQCHFRKSTKSSPSWLEKMIGSFVLSYDTLPIFAPRKCNLSSCRNSRRSVSVQYFFPVWACLRGMSMSVWHNLAFGRGARISLEFPAVIGFTHPLYGEWKFKSVLELVKVLARDKIRPYDVDGYGYSILFVSRFPVSRVRF